MTPTAIFVKMTLDRWNASLLSFNTLLDSLTDETLLKEVAPGKNRGIYLLGHLIAVHDDMLILLDMGDKIYPELQEPFLKNADKVSTDIPTVATLRIYWAKQCDIMKQKFDAFKPEDWLERHTAVTTDDFVNEPYRNKLNIVVTRTSHLQYHIGQLRLLK